MIDCVSVGKDMENTCSAKRLAKRDEHFLKDFAFGLPFLF